MSEAGGHDAIYESYRADHWGGARGAKNARDGRAHELKTPGEDPEEGRWVVERKDTMEETETGSLERLYLLLAYRIGPPVSVQPAGAGRGR